MLQVVLKKGVLPFGLETRQTLTLLVLSPIVSTSPAFSQELGEDAGLASTINSVSILISVTLVVGILTIIL